MSTEAKLSCIDFYSTLYNFWSLHIQWPICKLVSVLYFCCDTWMSLSLRTLNMVERQLRLCRHHVKIRLTKCHSRIIKSLLLILGPMDSQTLLQRTQDLLKVYKVSVQRGAFLGALVIAKRCSDRAKVRHHLPELHNQNHKHWRHKGTFLVETLNSQQKMPHNNKYRQMIMIIDIQWKQLPRYGLALIQRTTQMRIVASAILTHILLPSPWCLTS